MVWTDALTGTLCLLIAMAFAALHIMTSHKHRIWPNVPEYVRFGFLVTTCGMMGRGIDFFRLATPAGDGAQGHIDAVGLICTVAVCYTMCGLAYSIFRRAYSEGNWATLHYAETLAAADRKGGSLLRLFMLGFKVVAPNGKDLPPG